METVKGFKDYSGKEAEIRENIRKILVKTFEEYGFEPAETPIVEYKQFVQGDNLNDEAVSDIFKLQDRGKRDLALRYELTFSLKRLMQNKKLPYKRYSIGTVFRDEPISSNRFRQFTQCDIDTVGATIKDEAEILAIVNEVFNKMGIKNEIYIGNRKLINEILEKENISKNKEQIMRELDKLECKCKFNEKDVINNLKKLGAEKLIKIFKQPESSFKKYKSYSKIEELKKYCKYYSIKINFQPTLVRGLSYYSGNVFEIKTPEVKETITAGGTYIFNGINCTGISFGLDRLYSLAKLKINSEKYLIVSLNQDKSSIELAQKLRSKNNKVIIYYGKPSKALEYANSYQINKVIFIGEDEIKNKKIKIKDMKTGKESLFKN